LALDGVAFAASTFAVFSALPGGFGFDLKKPLEYRIEPVMISPITITMPHTVAFWLVVASAEKVRPLANHLPVAGSVTEKKPLTELVNFLNPDTPPVAALSSAASVALTPADRRAAVCAASSAADWRLPTEVGILADTTAFFADANLLRKLAILQVIGDIDQ